MTLSPDHSFAMVAKVSLRIDIAVKGDGRDPEFPAQFRDRCVPVGHGRLDRANLGLCQGECPPAFASSRSRSRRLKPSHGPLADKLAFEFGECGKDAEGQTAGCGCRVDRGALAGEDLQANATVGEHGDGLHQVMQAAAQPVEFPNDEDITFA